MDETSQTKGSKGSSKEGRLTGEQDDDEGYEDNSYDDENAAYIPWAYAIDSKTMDQEPTSHTETSGTSTVHQHHRSAKGRKHNHRDHSHTSENSNTDEEQQQPPLEAKNDFWHDKDQVQIHQQNEENTSFLFQKSFGWVMVATILSLVAVIVVSSYVNKGHIHHDDVHNNETAADDNNLPQWDGATTTMMPASTTFVPTTTTTTSTAASMNYLRIHPTLEAYLENP